MNILIKIGNFLQNQLLRMKWLNISIEKFIKYIGIDINTKIGASLHFFIYDVIKISLLLCILIFLISYIQSFFPPERSKIILGKFKGFWANIIAALLGTVTPFCSCSSIPLFIGFTSSGLSLGVTFSFLISSPMVDLASLVLLVSIFGMKIAIAYVILGLIISVIGGSIIERMCLEDQIEDFIRNSTKVESIKLDSMTRKDRINFSKNAVKETFLRVFPYVLIGVGIGALIHNWIPEIFIKKVLGGNNPFIVILATLIGIPIYADTFGTVSIAEALISKGAMLGTVLAFMMGVTTLSLPSIIMLRKAIKPKLLSIFIGITTIGIIIVGYIFNLFNNLFI